MAWLRGILRQNSASGVSPWMGRGYSEYVVGNLLGELPAGYFVVHDVVSKRGNIDHVVVSTKGILAIETKSHGIPGPEPRPVLLFANADVQVRKPVRGVEIISRRSLPDYLERLRNRMSAKEAKQIFETLKLSQSQMFVLQLHSIY